MIKVLKKLKNWQRKKKRKRYSLPNPQPLPISHCCSCSAKAQPSAPPLPPWFDVEQPQEAAPVSDLRYGSFPSAPQILLPPSDAITTEITPLLAPPALPLTASYQHYLASEPVCALPVMPAAASTRRYAGLFGCVINIGTFLIRCLCPCFRIRD